MAEDGEADATVQCPSNASFEGFCLRGSAYQTTVWELGSMGKQTASWLVMAGRRLFPYPLHYRVTLVVYGQNCSAFVRRDAESGDTVFEIKWDSREVGFVGSTPTAPFAKLALHLGKNDVVNGLKAYGFHHPAVHEKLLAELHSKYPHLCTQKPQKPLQAPSSTPPRSPHTSMQMARYQPTSVPPSPFLTTGCEIKSFGEKGRSDPTLDMHNLRLTVSATPRKRRTEAVMPRDARQGRGLITRKPSPTNTAPAAEGARTPRARRKTAAGGKSAKTGWTAFTAYAMEQREVVRAEIPGITPTAVEKTVGSRWQLMDTQAKQWWAEKARQIKRRARMQEEQNGDEDEPLEEDDEAPPPTPRGPAPATCALLAAVDHVSSEEGSEAAAQTHGTGKGTGSGHAQGISNSSPEGIVEKPSLTGGGDVMSKTFNQPNKRKNSSPDAVQAVHGFRNGEAFFGLEDLAKPPKKRRSSHSASGGSADGTHGAGGESNGRSPAVPMFLQNRPPGFLPRAPQSEHLMTAQPPDLAGGCPNAVRRSRRSPQKPHARWGSSPSEGGNLDLLAECAGDQL